MLFNLVKTIVNRKHVICLILVLTFGTTFGQYKITGVVTDTLQKPLDRVSVYLKTVSDSTITAFTFTDVKGRYTIQTPESLNYNLVFNALSYKTENRIVRPSAEDVSKPIYLDILLKNETLSLDEVVLSYEKKITVKKDTISLKASAFTDGTEEVVEDLLQKLPGIDIKADGTVTVEGQEVEKIMIEGDDLFEKGYKLLTKNLNSEIIDKIDILKRYSDNALLKGVENSDKVALNLTLKEGRKSQIFGNGSLGLGTRESYAVKLNLISFLNKSKFYALANFNNIGSDPNGDISTLLNPNLLGGSNFVGDTESLTNIVKLVPSTPQLEENRTNFNNAEFVSLNSIFNPTDRLKIKGIGLLSFDEIDFFRQSFSRYRLPDGTSFSNNEDYILRRDNDLGYIKMDMDYQIHKRSNLNYIGVYNQSDFNTTSRLKFNNQNISEDLFSKGSFHDHKLDYTLKTQKNQAFVLQARYLKQKLPETYDVDTFLYTSIFPNLNAIEELNQRIYHKLGFTGATANYIINHGKSNINVKLGYTKKKQEFMSNLSFIDNQGDISDQHQGYYNSVKFDRADFFTETTFRYGFKKLAVSTSFKTNQTFTKLEEELQKEVIHKNPFYASGNIQLQYDLDRKNKFITLFSLNNTTSDLKNLIGSFVLEDYRNFLRGINEFKVLQSNLFLFNYSYGNWSDEFLVNSSFLYNRTKDFYSTDVTINQDFNQSSQIILPNRTIANLNVSVDRFIKVFASNLKLKGSLSRINTKNKVNNSELRNVENIAVGYGVEFRTAFTKGFNFHIGTKWNTSIIKVGSENENTNNKTFFDVSYFFNEKLSFYLKNERYHFGNLESNRDTYFFSDIDIKYVLKKNKVSFKLSGQNLFDTTSFGNYTITDTNTNSSTYRLLPRYILFKIDYRF